MVSKGLFLLVMFMFTSSVFSTENTNGEEVRGRKLIEATYQLNHPPSVENYNPIPVSVVYEEDGYNAKSELTTETSTSDEDFVENVTTENVQTSTEEEKPITDFVNSVDSKRAFIPRARALNNLKIPVAVIYESDPSNYNRANPERNAESSRRRLNRRENLQTKTNDGISNEQTRKEIVSAHTSEVDSITPQPLGGKRIIKKRIGGRDPVVPILESESYVFSHRGDFHYRYEGGDGTKAYSEGKLKTVDEKSGESVVGGFSYTDKDGNDFSLSYTADENGYRPVGAHLPTPPPIPPAIARALKHLATATPEPVTKKPGNNQILE